MFVKSNLLFVLIFLIWSSLIEAGNKGSNTVQESNASSNTSTTDANYENAYPMATCDKTIRNQLQSAFYQKDQSSTNRIFHTMSMESVYNNLLNVPVAFAGLATTYYRPIVSKGKAKIPEYKYGGHTVNIATRKSIDQSEVTYKSVPAQYVSLTFDNSYLPNTLQYVYVLVPPKGFVKEDTSLITLSCTSTSGSKAPYCDIQCQVDNFNPNILPPTMYSTLF